MIVKNLSRTNTGGSGQLVKYIFRYIFREDGKRHITRHDYDRPFVLPKGVRFDEMDIRHLHSEIGDGILRYHFKEYCRDGNVIAYIQKYLMSPAYSMRSLDVPEKAPAPFVIRHNMRSNTLSGLIREFEDNEKGRIHKRVDQTSVHHTIISWSNKDSDKLTEAMLRDISREYIKLRGENNLYCGTLHTDRSHFHLHLSMSGTSLDGKSSRISKKDFEAVKVKLQEYQMKHYPELAHSIVDHRRKNKEKEKVPFEKNIRLDRTKGKDAVLRSIETNYAKAESTEHFLSLLNASGLKEYYRNGVLTGIRNEQGYKYRFSRLDVDLNFLHDLSLQKAEEAAALKELRQLREGRKRESRVKEVPVEVKDNSAKMELETDSKALEALKDIRAGRDNGQSRADSMDLAESTDLETDDESDSNGKVSLTDIPDERDLDKHGLDDDDDDDSS